MPLLTSLGLAIDHHVHLTTSCPRMLQGVKGGHIRINAACLGHAHGQGCMQLTSPAGSVESRRRS